MEIIPGLNNIKQKYIKMIEGKDNDKDKENLIRIFNMLINVKYNLFARFRNRGT